VPVATVRSVLPLPALPRGAAERWQGQAGFWQHLGERYWPLHEALAAVAAGVVRASSVIENLNSRLRSYFFLRRHLGPDYLELLQFFLNHRRFLRSEHPERVGKSPAELLTGVSQPHWLELLGYQRCSRNWCLVNLRLTGTVGRIGNPSYNLRHPEPVHRRWTRH
jgi:hypothetical protein